MNNEFEKLLTSLLDEYQECGDVNSVVEKAVKKMVQQKSVPIK